MAKGESGCGCCAGAAAITPQETVNRPGLSALAYRVGTHASFLETMKARLSSHSLDGEADRPIERGMLKRGARPLKDLKVRTDSDPSIAFMDAWAAVADVLTFYQERIANEGYLRTATERRSVLELARLIGYTLRPGVAASVWLALELEKDYQLKIAPHELRAQSLPDPGEMPQTFENIEPMEVRGKWNVLRPRLARPQTLLSMKGSSETGLRVYLRGTSTNLKPNDPLLIDSGHEQALMRVKEVLPDPVAARTLVKFEVWRKAVRIPLDRGGMARVVQELKEAKGFAVSLKTEMSKRVLIHLESLSRILTLRISDAEVIQYIEDLALPGLTAEHAAAKDDTKYSKHLPWIAGIVEALEKVAFRFHQEVPHAEELPAPSVISHAQVDIDPLASILPKLTAPPSIPPRNTMALPRSLAKSFEPRADTNLQLVSSLHHDLARTIPAALLSAKVPDENPIKVYALRLKAGPFGQNAPRRILDIHSETGAIQKTGEWPVVEFLSDSKTQKDPNEDADVLYLDVSNDKILPGSWIVVDTTKVAGTVNVKPANGPILITKAAAVQADLSRAEYGISGKSTRIQLASEWLVIEPKLPEITLNEIANRADFQEEYDEDFKLIRNTVVYAQSEELPLAEEPIEESICGGENDWIELDGLYSGLQPGRWVIVSGERTDINDAEGATVTGVASSELVMIAEAIQTVASMAPPGFQGKPIGEASSGDELIPLPGDRPHTFIKLAKKLEYCYRPDRVTLYGNVVKATHGETRMEILGSGNSGQAFQSFTLKQPPLTHVASPNPAGTESTLTIYVNDVKWRETESLSGKDANERIFTTRADNDGKTTVIFGNGRHGLRLPTGIENVRASYRSGIGKAGNARAEQISQLISRPLGLKGVINPLRASGGADPESRDAARKNAPRTVAALDRLVSVTDYADFAHTFAGIGKALAAKVSDGKRQWVHVTIAGAEDIPIDETSDLYRNLLRALHDHGDPYQPVYLQIRELMLLVINANIRISADYEWDGVVTAVRAKLLDTFSFDRRELGQDVLLSEVIATIQSVRGVEYVDVDVMGGVPEKKSEAGARRLLTPREISRAVLSLVAIGGAPKQRLTVNLAEFERGAMGVMRPAQLAYLSPEVAATLVINQIKP